MKIGRMYDNVGSSRRRRSRTSNDENDADAKCALKKTSNFL